MVSYEPRRGGGIQQLSLNLQFVHNQSGSFTLLSVLFEDWVQYLLSVIYFFWKLVIHPKCCSFQLPPLLFTSSLLEMFKFLRLWVWVRLRCGLQVGVYGGKSFYLLYLTGVSERSAWSSWGVCQGYPLCSLGFRKRLNCLACFVFEYQERSLSVSCFLFELWPSERRVVPRKF